MTRRVRADHGPSERNAKAHADRPSEVGSVGHGDDPPAREEHRSSDGQFHGTTLPRVSALQTAAPLLVRAFVQSRAARPPTKTNACQSVR